MQVVRTQPKSKIFDEMESQVRGYCRHFDGIFDSAEGSTIRTAEGKVYIDFLAGCASLNYGHNDPDMKAALVAHLSRDGIAHGLDLHTSEKSAFLETFRDTILSPRGLDYRVQFTGPTGANAVEAALKLARKVTGRTTVIAFTNGYHGVSLGALAATGNAFNRRGAATPLADVSRALYDGYLGAEADTAELLDRLLDDPSSGYDAPAAIILETVQGEGGLNAASAGWLRRIAEIARRHGALVIIDDIQAGCGRAGSFFSFEKMGVVPDMVTLSKSLSGFGLPMSLVLIRPEYDQWQPGEHNGTFRGNTHAFVTARVALEKFWRVPGFEEDIAAKANMVTARLREIAAEIPRARLKGRGMMQGIDVGFGETATRICQQCFENGLIIETSGPRGEVIKLLAPLTTPEPLLERGLDILMASAVAVSGRCRVAAE